MIERFQKSSLVGQFIMIVLGLVAVLIILGLVLAILKMLIPIFVVAAVIVGVLWLYRQVSGEK